MNVVVVAAHGLNCHWLGPYGNAWVSTPAADALACESVTFDRHFADDPSPAGFQRSCPAPLVAALRSAGVTTAIVDDRKERAPDDRGWDLTLSTALDSHSTPADALLVSVRQALDWLAHRARWLLWIETEWLTPPWDLELETYQQYASTSGGFAEDEAGQDFAEIEPTDEPTTGPFDVNDDRQWHRLHNSFAAAVTAFDSELGTLLQEFRSRGLDQSAAWIVTSGHGWPLGEHGLVGPAGSRMHEELVHLPLLIRLAGHRQGMRRVSALTRVSDLAATLSDLFGVAVPAGIGGSSLLPLMSGTAADGRDAVKSSTGPERAVRTAEWAFLAADPASDRPARLYRKPDDIWEVNDLAPRLPDECDRLAALLEKEPNP